MICKICGDECSEDECENGICLNCMSSILQNDEIDLGFGDDFE